MAEETLGEYKISRQLKLAGIVFAMLFTVLVAGYYLFLRMNYAVLYQNLSSLNAAAIVTELDTREIRYKLDDAGTTILVPAYKADAVRLAIIGADAPLNGVVGFELFNESEMGLTEFAQKIKYQRALQGELARTIMLMDGIESARVHIAVPERVLFRGNTSAPKAAVTIVTRQGYVGDHTSIAGIQRLVAAAVPDLQASQVVVLNAGGDVISNMSSVASSSVTVSTILPVEGSAETPAVLSQTLEATLPQLQPKTTINLPSRINEGLIIVPTIPRPFYLQIWFLATCAVFVFGLICVMLARLRRRILTDAECKGFAKILSQQLNVVNENNDAIS